MIKIIKQGNKPKSNWILHCEKCECEWEATDIERLPIPANQIRVYNAFRCPNCETIVFAKDTKEQ